MRTAPHALFGESGSLTLKECSVFMFGGQGFVEECSGLLRTWTPPHMKCKTRSSALGSAPLITIMRGPGARAGGGGASLGDWEDFPESGKGLEQMRVKSALSCAPTSSSPYADPRGLAFNLSQVCGVEVAFLALLFFLAHTLDGLSNPSAPTPPKAHRPRIRCPLRPPCAAAIPRTADRETQRPAASQFA